MVAVFEVKQDLKKKQIKNLLVANRMNREGQGKNLVVGISEGGALRLEVNVKEFETNLQGL